MFWIFVCFGLFKIFLVVVLCIGGNFLFCFVCWGGLVCLFLRGFVCWICFAVQMLCSYRYLSSSLTSPWNLITRCCYLQLSLLKFCQLC